MAEITAETDGILETTVERAPNENYHPADEIVDRLRVFAADWAVGAVMDPRRNIDVRREDGTYDGLMLSARALAAATVQRRGTTVSAHPPGEIAGIAAAGYELVSRAWPQACDPQVLRDVRLATYFDDAYCNKFIGSADKNPIVAERLMEVYDFQRADRVLNAVVALHSLRTVENYTLEDGVRLGGETFRIVMAAKTHYDLGYGHGPMHSSRETDDNTRELSQKKYKTHLRTMEKLLSEPQEFESKTALLMPQYIFSSQRDGLWHYARHAKIEPHDDLLRLEETRERILKAYVG